MISAGPSRVDALPEGCLKTPASGAVRRPAKKSIYAAGKATIQYTVGDGAPVCVSFSLTDDATLGPDTQYSSFYFTSADDTHLEIDLESDDLEATAARTFVTVLLDGGAQSYPDSRKAHCAATLSTLSGSSLSGTFSCTDVPEADGHGDPMTVRGTFAASS